MKNNDIKNELRTRIKLLRGDLTEDVKRNHDNKIFKKIIESNEYKSSKIIFIYVSFDKEVDTIKLIKKALEDKKNVLVPKIISLKDGMIAVEISSLQELSMSKYNILEPMLPAEIKHYEIDLCIIPGVAFDVNGGRVGYGGGFYDRFLVKLKKDVSLIALGYKFQILDYVPMEEFDIKISSIISE